MKNPFAVIRERIRSKSDGNLSSGNNRKTTPATFHEVADDGRSEIFYLDDNNNYADKETATHSIIRQTDENGMLVGEVFSVNKNARRRKLKTWDEFTEEEKQFLRRFRDKDGNYPWADKK